jgi:hypothetical protein
MNALFARMHTPKTVTLFPFLSIYKAHSSVQTTTNNSNKRAQVNQTSEEAATPSVGCKMNDPVTKKPRPMPSGRTVEYLSWFMSFPTRQHSTQAGQTRILDLRDTQQCKVKYLFKIKNKIKTTALHNHQY